MKKLLTIVAVLGLAFGAFAQELKPQNLVKASVGTLTLADNTTSNLTSTVYNDARLWANKDGTTANVALLFSVVGTNAAATNTFTFTVRPVHDVGTTSVNDVTDSVRSFAVALVATGTTRATIATNVPTALLQGVKALRLVSVATSDEGGNAAGMVATAKLVGFVP